MSRLFLVNKTDDTAILKEEIKESNFQLINTHKKDRNRIIIRNIFLVIYVLIVVITLLLI